MCHIVICLSHLDPLNSAPQIQWQDHPPIVPHCTQLTLSSFSPHTHDLELPRAYSFFPVMLRKSVLVAYDTSMCLLSNSSLLFHPSWFKGRGKTSKWSNLRQHKTNLINLFSVMLKHLSLQGGGRVCTLRIYCKVDWDPCRGHTVPAEIKCSHLAHCLTTRLNQKM